mmetsp:Transcript_36902/g.116078  ORF Transcript_36902/g.116078 Transcript_36902/m.116078 type:complete len:233 (+) Transcript_36902:395-1093(+)
MHGLSRGGGAVVGRERPVGDDHLGARESVLCRVELLELAGELRVARLLGGGVDDEGEAVELLEHLGARGADIGEDPLAILARQQVVVRRHLGRHRGRRLLGRTLRQLQLAVDQVARQLARRLGAAKQDARGGVGGARARRPPPARVLGRLDVPSDVVGRWRRGGVRRGLHLCRRLQRRRRRQRLGGRRRRRHEQWRLDPRRRPARPRHLLRRLKRRAHVKIARRRTVARGRC